MGGLVENLDGLLRDARSLREALAEFRAAGPARPGAATDAGFGPMLAELAASVSGAVGALDARLGRLHDVLGGVERERR